jgi:hypothetical protein
MSTMVCGLAGAPRSGRGRQNVQATRSRHISGRTSQWVGEERSALSCSHTGSRDGGSVGRVHRLSHQTDNAGPAQGLPRAGVS